MAGYDSALAVCPYYHKCDSNRICCDGVETGSTTHVVFGDPKRLKAYRARYCDNIKNYKRCRYCEMFDRIYEST